MTHKEFPKDERYSPSWWFRVLDMHFDMDVAAPYKWDKLPGYSVPASVRLTQQEDGLKTEWSGVVWMNPPFGGRNEIEPWLQKFVEHGNGIGCCWGRTASGWFQKYMKEMNRLVFLENKKQFVYPDGTPCGCAKDGVVLFSRGARPTIQLSNFRNYGVVVDAARK